MQILRDWRYAAPLGALVAITVIAAMLAGKPDDQAAALVGPTQTAAPAPTQAAASPVSVRTPDLGDVLLDSRRKLDLAGLRDALETYRARFGAYPSTQSAFQTACSDPKDALCALNGVVAKLSFSDGQKPYEYRSDGVMYTLYSAMQTASAAGACSAEVPSDLAGHPVFCLGQGGSQ